MLLDNTPQTTFKKNNLKHFNLKEELSKYLSKWYLFLLSFLFFGAMAYLYIKYTVPQYQTSATISISEEENLNESALNAFQDLGVLDQAKDKISREIQLLRSKTLINNVVKKLNLNVQYFTQGRILERENYPKSAIEINFLSADSIVNSKFQSFEVLINSKTSFSFLDEDGIVSATHSFGKTIETGIGNIVITPTNLNGVIGKVIKIKVSPIEYITRNYRNRLSIFETYKGTSVVNISLNDPSKEKAKDIINLLIDEYQTLKISQKKEKSSKTAIFIDERIRLISSDLTNVDNEAAGYKSRFGLTNDLASDTQRVAQFDSQSVQEISALKTKLRLIESMQGFIQSQDAMYSTIPSNLGFDDVSITNGVAKYNSLILQRKRLLKTSSAQNPVVVNIDEQLNNLRQILNSALINVKSTVNIQLSSIQTQEKYFSGKLYVAPTRQKDLRVIEREQTVKEQLYLYLLQKREEAEITSHITVPNSRIIDRASTYGSFPVSPNKKNIYLGAFCLAFMIPFLSIYLKNLLNTTVNSRIDLEESLTIPILGVIPKSNLKKKIVIEEKSREPISEAFRILRTNLDFLMAGVKKESGKIIFVTSSISGEGKTFVSSNLAKTLAIYGSKVAYVGTDFRYPKFHEFLDLPNGKKTIGLTNYIMDKSIKPSEIIYSEKKDNPIHIIPSGVIPPNPSGLLMQPRVKEMFTYLENNFDYIIVDTAPVTLVTDTLIISKYADLSIYLIREGFTDKRLLNTLEKYQQEKRLNNMALLLNSAKLGMENNYGY